MFKCKLHHSWESWWGLDHYKGIHPCGNHYLPISKSELCWESLGWFLTEDGFRDRVWGNWLAALQRLCCVPSGSVSCSFSPQGWDQMAQVQRPSLLTSKSPDSPHLSHCVMARLLLFGATSLIRLSPISPSSCSVSYEINRLQRKWMVALCVVYGRQVLKAERKSSFHALASGALQFSNSHEKLPRPTNTSYYLGSGPYLILMPFLGDI